ncbi:hypothetical protein ABVK25_008984 [Lepraria finkii]|uniref:Uncharacterized protein n=1 Tax=Lepraria finkii TaxID=1340010 RepID=A0ABR4B1E8_9LECA
MPGENVDTFTHFQIWLYSKELPLTDISGEELDEVDLVDLYIFGEARNIPEFINAAMDALITRTRRIQQRCGGISCGFRVFAGVAQELSPERW